MSAAPLRIVSSLVFLMAVWLVWSGYLKPLLVILGLLSSVLVVTLAVRMGNLDEESDWLRLLPRFPRFWLWLSRQVVLSNIDVARLILSPRPALETRLVTIAALPKDGLGRAILGNCITLTPGTITLETRRGRLRVHCLTRKAADDLRAGEMNRRVAALTKK
jgi:multicomponent Na+:H+ antiporter subunit E